MSVRPWRHAASLMIAKKKSHEIGQSLGTSSRNQNVLRMLNGSVVSGQEYKLLMLKRAKTLAFPNSYVFPGGVVDKADFSSKWWDVFKKRGPSGIAEVSKIIKQSDEPRPGVLQAATYTYTDESANDSQKLPPEVALRLTAIRETFEECGVLIARRNTTSLMESVSTVKVDDTVKWQKRVQKNAGQMMQLCLELDCCPDVWGLHEWSIWLTPAQLKPRFETLFFLCTLNEKPNLYYSPDEVSNHLWCSPLELLELYANKKIWLPPPQIYELSRLLNITELELLEEFAVKRQSNNLTMLFPVRAHARDGFLQLLTGDDLYPAEPDFLGNSPVLTYNHSLQELEDDALYLNRLSFDDNNLWRLVCNVELRDGHKKPLSLNGCLLTSNL